MSSTGIALAAVPQTILSIYDPHTLAAKRWRVAQNSKSNEL